MKIKFWILIIGYALCIMRYASYAQDDNRLVILSKQIIEAKNNEEAYLTLEKLGDLYFNESKYNEFADFLDSLTKQKKTLEPVVNYYIGLTRYYQLKHLEETQGWDEYFSQGNTYRDQISTSLQKTIVSLAPENVLSLYARLILWKFHRDQNDTLAESALSDLMNSALAYAKNANNLVPIKDVAEEFLSYGEKGKAKELYQIYVTKLVASDIKEDALNTIALGFYKEGNLELSEAIYDVYLERVLKLFPKEKAIPILFDIATAFSYKEDGAKDIIYAEKVFQKIEEVGGKDVFNEELIYLRAFNLEKIKEYAKAKDFYIDLVQRYPQAIHADEADFKLGIIFTYILRDIKSGRAYFEKLAQKETLSPQVISGLYQSGLLSQWEADSIKAKEYYNKLIERAKDNFTEIITLAEERLKEIEEQKPMEYNLKTFLDVSLKQDDAMFNMAKLDLRTSVYRVKKDAEVNISSTPYLTESGCIQIELQYLWSGDLGKESPSSHQATFATSYPQAGIKVINLVVVLPTGIIDYSLDLVDVY